MGLSFVLGLRTLRIEPFCPHPAGPQVTEEH